MRALANPCCGRDGNHAPLQAILDQSMKAPAGDLPDRTGQSEMFTAEIGKAPHEIP